MSLILNLAGVCITIFFGLWAVITPKQFAKILSLSPFKERGVTEIRTTYGGLMLGLSVYALIMQEELIFNCLGYGWLGAAVVRFGAMTFLDNSFSKKNLSFVMIELVVGLCLLL